MLLTPNMIADMAADVGLLNDMSPLSLPESEAAYPTPMKPLSQALLMTKECNVTEDRRLVDIVIAQHRAWLDHLRTCIAESDPFTVKLLLPLFVEADNPSRTVRFVAGLSQDELLSLYSPARELIYSLKVRIVDRRQHLGL